MHLPKCFAWCKRSPQKLFKIEKPSCKIKSQTLCKVLIQWVVLHCIGPEWTNTHQCTNVDGWCTDRILFSIPVPSQVDLFRLRFLSCDLSFLFGNFIFSPPPSPVFFSPLISVFSTQLFIYLFIYFWETFLTHLPIYLFMYLAFDLST
jgi:hypothetical protein